MKLNEIKNWSEACDYAATLPLNTEQDCEGTPNECFLAGWVNAADMIDDKELNPEDNEEVLRFVLSEVGNMYPELISAVN